MMAADDGVSRVVPTITGLHVRGRVEVPTLSHIGFLTKKDMIYNLNYPPLSKTLLGVKADFYISDGDLEKALVLGMSPHERRRFEKKRGYVFKHMRKSYNPIDAEDEDDSLHPNMADASQEQDYANILEDAKLGTHESSPSIRDNTNGETSGNGNLPNGTTNSNEVKDDLVKNDSKMSLLVHGPHGKQVVEYLVKEGGEDGIHEFCQRWRRVFIEALHPRFLPGGWDVKHRYAL